MEQGSVEWKAARSGKITASQMSRVLAGAQPKSALCIIGAKGEIIEKIGNGLAAEKKAAALRAIGSKVENRIYEYTRGDGFDSYALELAAEIITSEPIDTPETQAMRDGTKREPLARMAYEVRTGYCVLETGLLIHPTMPYVGASPDGLIPDIRRGCEIKSPSPVKHLKTLLYGMPKEHMPQVQAGMAVTGYEEWDFISFHPLFPAPNNLFIQTIKRDENIISMMNVMCDELIGEVMKIVSKIRSM